MRNWLLKSVAVKGFIAKELIAFDVHDETIHIVLKMTGSFVLRWAALVIFLVPYMI